MLATKPAHWTAAVIKGEVKFMGEWHKNEESASDKRKRMRMIALIR